MGNVKIQAVTFFTCSSAVDIHRMINDGLTDSPPSFATFGFVGSNVVERVLKVHLARVPQILFLHHKFMKEQRIYCMNSPVKLDKKMSA